MEPPPSYQEILSLLKKESIRNQELEQRVKELQQYLDQTKTELNKVKSSYSVVKKNELMLVSLLQSKI
jgi:uncharacterized small protein (DUF1192 family)